MRHSFSIFQTGISKTASVFDSILSLRFFTSSARIGMAMMLFAIMAPVQPVFSQCNVVAYSSAETAGNQPYTQRLGMSFTVNSPVVISDLGAFDSDGDGLLSTIQVGIIRSDGAVMAGPISLSGAGDPLVNGHRMYAITPFILSPGSYVIVAVGYGSSEMNGNTNLGDLPVTTNNGGGLLTFDGASYGGAGFGLPTTAEASPTTSYHAGTFRYSNLPACPANVVVTTSTGANTDQLGGDCVALVRGINVENLFANCPNTTISYEISGATNTSGNGDASGTYFYTGVSTVTYIFTDKSVPANTASCSFTVTVEDDESPEIRCPKNVTIDTDPGLCTGNYTYDVTFDDNCYGVDANGFEEEFAPAFWNLSNSNGGDGTINTTGAPIDVILTGSNNGGSNNTDYCISIPGVYSGMMTFDWNYKTFDDPFYDRFGYTVDGVFTQLSNNVGGTPQSGSVSIMLNPGQQFCFRIYSVDGILGAAVTIAMQFTYMEDINPDLAQDSGLPSGSNFPKGTTTNEFTVTDNNDNAATCSFTVTVVDNENPKIKCPADIEVELDPLECEVEVLFSANATDNCPGVTWEVSSSLESGDFFPIGENIVVYQATDAEGNSATCSFEVTIVDYFNSSLGCINRNVSLDQNCQAIVDPFMVLTGYLDINGDTLLGCLDSFKVNIKNPLGVNIGNSVDGDYLGKTLDYTISNPSHGFYCWGTIKIEDKLRPFVVCENDTISCVEPRSNIKKPKLVDNCDGGQLITLYDFEDTLQCNLKFLSKITRIYTAKDKYGNQGDTCTQIIFVERTDLSNIKFPDHFTGSKALECNKFADDANGRPLVSVTGVPKLKNINIYPFNQSFICNGFVTYTDNETFTTSCKRIINRTWEVGEWWCDKTMIQTWVQVIEIKDKEAPVITNLADMTISTGSNSCSATFNLPKANVTDNCNTWSVNISTGYDTLKTNGGVTTLPVGKHAVTYYATDLCSNLGIKTISVTVEDRAEPIAICEARAVVSLKEDGTAWLYSESVDDGSFDECGPVYLKIRRVNSECDTMSLNWSDAVGFCCEDAGEKNIMVELQVTDQGGRTNRCMMLVEVQDKRVPTLTSAYTVTVNCSTTFDTTDLGAVFGYPVISGGGCADLDDVTETFNDLLNDCRIGNLHRKFILEHNGNAVDSCSHTITFAPERPFNANMIDWPNDTSFVNSLCTPFDLDPENLPEGYGMPQLIEEGVCDLVAFSYDQDVYSFTSNNACYKIVRHWTVIDWCYYVNGKLWQDTFDQVIVIMNTEGPRITSPTTRREVCSYNADCTPASIKLTAAADDKCTPQSELKWRWTITFEDGKKKNGTGNDASGIYPFGNHRIDFEVEDKCGNISYTGYLFDVKSCKPPTAYCKHGLSTSLVGMDTNGDNQLDAEMSMVTPEMFDNGSEQGCGNSIVLSFSEDVEDDTLWLDCSNLSAPKEVKLWVTDENDNQNHCTTYIIVKDSNNVNICPPGIIESNVNGRIHTSDNKGISDVSVKLVSAEERIDITEGAGEYSFGLLPKGVQYLVKPEKSDNPLNGVSTLDLVLIQRHILGISKLDDPLKLIAADINQDGKVTASDLVILRKLILGVENQLPNDQSWKFVWDGHQWADPTNPWATPITESYDISFLLEDMEINFTGIKLGDLNGNVVANVYGNITENRSSKVFSMTYADHEVRSGENIRIPIIAATFNSIHGLQATLTFDGMIVKSIEGVTLEGLSEENIYRKSDDSINISWVSKGAANIKAGDVLMYVDAEVTGDGQLSKMITMDYAGLSAQAYLGVEFEIADLEIRSKEKNDIYQEFDLGMAKPNPWNESSFIAVILPKDGIISLSVQDNAGKLVHARDLVLTAGKHQIELNRTTIGSTGSFIYSVTYEGETKYGKMIIID
ncbi:MAG: HYR domain-containing protein [Saprospiraceae bacterium]|nr:HYR domain-containing protein [Saprospiraceae bacterium]